MIQRSPVPIHRSPLPAFDITPCECKDCSESIQESYPPPQSEVSPRRTPWAINCKSCGLVHLSSHGYHQQLYSGKTLGVSWICPKCGKPAEVWDGEWREWVQVMIKKMS